MNKDLTGANTLEAIRVVVGDNQDIAEIEARAYFYIPSKPSMDDEKILKIMREEFLSGEKLEEFVTTQETGWNVAINSKVRLHNGLFAHIPMLDLAPRKSPEALEKVVRRLSEIIKPYFGSGYILETRKSYHYLGNKIFDENRFNEFLGRSLITSIVTKMPDEIPNVHEHIADYRFIGYSLMRMGTGLRITANGDKEFLPKVIAEV